MPAPAKSAATRPLGGSPPRGAAAGKPPWCGGAGSRGSPRSPSPEEPLAEPCAEPECGAPSGGALGALRAGAAESMPFEVLRGLAAAAALAGSGFEDDSDSEGEEEAIRRINLCMRRLAQRP